MQTVTGPHGRLMTPVQGVPGGGIGVPLIVTLTGGIGSQQLPFVGARDCIPDPANGKFCVSPPPAVDTVTNIGKHPAGTVPWTITVKVGQHGGGCAEAFSVPSIHPITIIAIAMSITKRERDPLRFMILLQYMWN